RRVSQLSAILLHREQAGEIAKTQLLCVRMSLPRLERKPWQPLSRLGGCSFARFPYNPKLFGFVSVAENWIELHPGHIGLGDKGLVAAGAFGRRGFLSPRRIRKRMMAEIEETPAIRRCEPLAVFHGDIHSVVFAVEISSAGWLRARAVGKGGI